MDTAYNRRIASEVDAINHRAARHAPANFVGRGYGSDCGIDTQYRDVMGAAYNHPRDLSRVERENRAEANLKMFGGNFLDDIGQAFRYTPVGMISDAAQGRDTVFSGRGRGGGDDIGGNSSSGIGGNSPGGVGGNSATMVGVTMPFREAGNPGVVDFADPLRGGLKYPVNTKVQVGNSDGSGEPPKVGCAWYASLEDYRGGRNRMMESKKIGRMTTMPVMPTDLTEEEDMFIQDLFKKSKGGAGYYGGEWYNNWDDFTEAIADAYDTIKGVWEDYIKPVLDVVGTPLKDALIDSGNPYGEAGGAFLELLGYGDMASGSNDPNLYEGMGRPGMSGGRSGGNMALGAGDGCVGGAGSDGNGRPGMSGGRSGGARVGVFANAKPIAANSLGFDPKLEVEQLNAATGSTSYGDMPTSNPVGSGRGGLGGRKRLVKNDSGVSSAPLKMGEGLGDFFKSKETKRKEKEEEEAKIKAKMYLQNFNMLHRKRMEGEKPGTASYDAAFARSKKDADDMGYIWDSKDHKWEIFYTRVYVKPKGSGMAGEGFEDEGFVVTTPRDMERHEYERYTSLEKNAENDSKTARLKQAAKDILEAARRNAPELATYGRNKLLDYVADKLPAEYKAQVKFLGYALSQPYIEEWKKSIKDEVKDRPLRQIGQGKGGKKWWEEAMEKADEGAMDEYIDRNVAQGDKMKPGRHLESDMEDAEEYRKKQEREESRKRYGFGRGGSKASMERAGLAVSGDNSMGAIVAERGFSKKSQKKAAAVEDKAADNMWDGTKMENVAGRSGKANPSLILQSATRGQKGVSHGGDLLGGVHPLTQTNNLQGVYGGGGEKSGLKRKGQSNAYSQLTKKIMAEKGMRLGEASAYIKANGLYKKSV